MAINSRNERARQFIPFDALKGLKEAYKIKEIEVEKRKDLSEELNDELNRKILELQNGEYIKIKYYKNYRYVYKEGIVKRLDKQNRLLIFQDNDEIKVKEIIKIFYF